MGLFRQTAARPIGYCKLDVEADDVAVIVDVNWIGATRGD